MQEGRYDHSSCSSERAVFVFGFSQRSWSGQHKYSKYCIEMLPLTSLLMGKPQGSDWETIKIGGLINFNFEMPLAYALNNEEIIFFENNEITTK